jgi:hypothetical protein
VLAERLAIIRGQRGETQQSTSSSRQRKSA